MQTRAPEPCRGGRRYDMGVGRQFRIRDSEPAAVYPAALVFMLEVGSVLCTFVDSVQPMCMSVLYVGW